MSWLEKVITFTFNEVVKSSWAHPLRKRAQGPGSVLSQKSQDGAKPSSDRGRAPAGERRHRVGLPRRRSRDVRHQ